MRWFRDPEPDPDVERFRGALLSLHSEGKLVGHVATEVGTFSTVLNRQRQWWVWLVVVFEDGAKYDRIEDYPPWTYVRELLDGYLDWADPTTNHWPLEAHWVDQAEVPRMRADLGIRPEDF